MLTSAKYFLTFSNKPSAVRHCIGQSSFQSLLLSKACNRSFHQRSSSIIIQHHQNRLADANQILKDILEKSQLSKNLIESNKFLTHAVLLKTQPDEFEKLPPKCSACGVILQTDMSDGLGFIPEKKVLDSIKNDSVKCLTCYDCFQLRYHNKASLISKPSKGELLDQLRHLRRRKALVLYILDIFNLEGSVIENLLSLIGARKRVIIVANKVDRIPQDDTKAVNQLERMKDVVKNTCLQYGLAETNFRDICLVSGKTGFGLHALVQKIGKHRDMNMDVYLVGAANTGKSTLYNLIVNMLNVHKAERLPNQAIEHHLPGTTVGLVRESISMRRLRRLEWRLANGPWQEEEGFEFDEELLNFLNVKDTAPYVNPPLMLKDGNKSIQKQTLQFVDSKTLRGNEEKPNFIYDTPGIINESQILQYLHSDEINYLTPDQWVVPRTVLMKPGSCMFIGGLARLDYLNVWRPEIDDVMEKAPLAQSSQSIYVTVMASPNLPLHLTQIDGADEKYSRLFLNGVFNIPSGTQQRLDEFPSLQPRDYTVLGKNLNINASDITVNGVGWISVAAVHQARVQVALHTPDGKGQSFRREPLLPYSVRKKSGRGVSYLGRINNKMYGHTRKISPPFVRVFQQQNDPVYSWKTKIFQKQKQERFQAKELQRLQRLKDGVVLGKWRAIKDKEEKLKLLMENQTKQLEI